MDYGNSSLRKNQWSVDEGMVNEELQKGSLAELAREFLRLGFIAFGGPPAHTAMMQERFVERKKWLTRRKFLDLFGAASLLPGPSSTELAIFVGQWHSGLAGLLVAGACFILPSALLVGILAWAYVRFGGLPQVEGILFGIKPVVVALVVQAVSKLARTALKSWELGILAAFVAVLSALHWPIVALLIAAGVLWMLFRLSQTGGQISLIAVLEGAALATGSASVTTVALFLYFLKIGAVVFGSGFVLLAILHADLVVHLKWITEAQLLDAIAVSQATPGPFFTVATFLGYLLGGAKGAGMATIGMFLPAFLYVAVTAQFLERVRSSAAAGAFLDGVNAAALALMAVVAVQFAAAVMHNWAAILIFAASLLLLWRYKVGSAWVVLGGAIAGIVLGWK